MVVSVCGEVVTRFVGIKHDILQVTYWCGLEFKGRLSGVHPPPLVAFVPVPIPFPGRRPFPPITAVLPGRPGAGRGPRPSPVPVVLAPSVRAPAVVSVLFPARISVPAPLPVVPPIPITAFTRPLWPLAERDGIRALCTVTTPLPVPPMVIRLEPLINTAVKPPPPASIIQPALLPRILALQIPILRCPLLPNLSYIPHL